VARQPADPDVLTVDGAAAMLGVDKRLIYAYLRDGKIPGKRVGKAWRLSRPQIHIWLGEIEDESLRHLHRSEDDDDDDEG